MSKHIPGEDRCPSELEAVRMFRIVNGSGDAGSEREFYCQTHDRQMGWRRLAAGVLARIKKAAEARVGSDRTK